MDIVVINGPNINLLGIREPDIYGNRTYKDLCEYIQSYCDDKGIGVSFFQSNSEGDLVDRIQQCLNISDGIVINPAAYTHTSVAIPDAIKSVGVPAVEVHLSDLSKRESFRRHSYTSPVCVATFMGLGFDGYLRAIDLLIAKGE